jgi:hypothetical protein
MRRGRKTCILPDALWTHIQRFIEEVVMSNRIGNGGAASGGVYGLAFIGAAVYFIGHAATFWLGVLGFLKALVWPAFVVYELMKHLGM